MVLVACGGDDDGTVDSTLDDAPSDATWIDAAPADAAPADAAVADANPNAISCASLLAGNWSQDLTSSDVLTTDAWEAYQGLQGCACTRTLSQAGCADICSMALNGTMTPNFCDASATLAQCNACIEAGCSVEKTTCSAN